MSDLTLQEESGRRGDSWVVLHQICTPVDTLHVSGILVEGCTNDVLSSRVSCWVPGETDTMMSFSITHMSNKEFT